MFAIKSSHFYLYCALYNTDCSDWFNYLKFFNFKNKFNSATSSSTADNRHNSLIDVAKIVNYETISMLGCHLANVHYNGNSVLVLMQQRDKKCSTKINSQSLFIFSALYIYNVSS